MAGQAVPDLRQQVGMTDQDFGAAVREDIGDLFGLEVPVDRYHRTAQRRGAAGDIEERKIVAQHHGDRPAAAKAERTKPARRAGDAGVNLRIGNAAVAADDHGSFTPGGRPEYRRSRPSSCRRSGAAAIAGTADSPRNWSILSSQAAVTAAELRATRPPGAGCYRG